MVETQALPRPLMQSAGLRVIMLDQQLRILAIRGAGLSSLGGRHASIGKPFDHLLPFAAPYRDRLQAVAEGGPSLDLSRLNCREPVLDFKGYFSLHGCAAQHGGGVILLLQDVDEQAVAECGRLQERNELRIARHQLEQATADAQAASRAKSTFLAHVSHELKTPLAVITGNADILSGMKIAFDSEAERQELEREIREYAQDIRESGEFLASLVTDLLDIVRAETGRFALNERTFDFVELATEVIASLARLPAARDVDVVMASRPPSAAIFGDPVRLRQVLVNLLTNAIHASPVAGRVELEIKRGGHGQLEITIGDEGAGVDPNLASRIFEPFAGGQGGTGLGLTIARNLVELHGGVIALEPRIDKGTVARFHLPPERVKGE